MKYYTKKKKFLFNPKNPNKYNGDASKIQYRSSWELSMMLFLDGHASGSIRDFGRGASPRNARRLRFQRC
jgi:prepilin-type processing-associated H-X9-DG protein